MRDVLMRTALFVPGNRPERFAKALSCGTDAVIVDFEDAVQESEKVAARQHLAQFLADNPDARVWVRVNTVNHPQHAAELDFCTRQKGVIGLLLPKAEHPADVARAALSGKAIIPIIESAQGLQELAEIAQTSGVERLTYGGLDFSLDLGLVAGSAGAERMLDHVRFALLLHSRLASLAPPLETVFARIDDEQGVAAFMTAAQAMGFAGMLCIHPAQVGIVHQVMRPDALQLSWAQRVLERARDEAGAFQLDGQMIDAPVIQRARNLLAASHTS
ncbi:MAG: HpcH/HpaI aldolase/citrate lyase family protein [Pseudomonas sp.]|uniref:HpcH/HpaI aldolase/citrate lyase family protein n=1 Tax=Pseudomonas sp. TaxID=306 RepID=UPI003D6FC8D2